MGRLHSDKAYSNRLTNIEFWDSSYKNRSLDQFDPDNWRNISSRNIINTIEKLRIEKSSICEVGGGDAELLCYLASRYHNSEFSIIDFSAVGCDLAKKRAEKENVKLSVFQEDIFYPPRSLTNKFDFIISQGVVEHFLDLSSVMRAKSRLLKKGGKILTLIPNFSSPIYAYLCKRWSKTVYEEHVPHSMRSFLAGHEQAGLTPIEQNYLGTISFDMLSGAIAGPEKISWLDFRIYLYLSRLSKAINYVETKTTSLPSTRLFSPFMYIISVKK